MINVRSSNHAEYSREKVAILSFARSISFVRLLKFPRNFAFPLTSTPPPPLSLEPSQSPLSSKLLGVSKFVYTDPEK